MITREEFVEFIEGKGYRLKSDGCYIRSDTKYRITVRSTYFYFRNYYNYNNCSIINGELIIDFTLSL